MMTNSALEKVNAITDLFTCAFDKDARRLIERADALMATAKANGWTPNTFRIVPENKGFAVQEMALLTSGKWEWRRVSWASNKPAAERAMALRKNG